MNRISALGILGVFFLFLTGCGKEEGEKLTICISDLQEYSMKLLAEGWQEVEGGSEIEFVIIPTEPEEAELKLSELRTEIMAGEGPDLFVMECKSPTLEESHGGLFKNLKKSMETELFLPLDEYLEHAEYINTDTWNTTVLEAGKTEEGQVVLPMYYHLPGYVFDSGDLSGEEIPDSWERLLASEDPVLKKAVRQKAFLYFGYSFGKLVDDQSGKLAFTEEELSEYLKQLLAFEEDTDEKTDGQEIPEAIADGWVNSEFLSAVNRAEKELTCIPVPDREGGAAAMVTMFAAINRNTGQAEGAFSFLDFMLSDEVTSGVGFQKGDKRYGAGIELDYYHDGISVNQKVFEEKNCRNDKVKNIFETFNGNISSVRFYSELDRDLYELYRMCFLSGDPDVDRLVTETYQTMEMRLSE